MAFDYPVLGLVLKCTRPLPYLEPRPGAHGEILRVTLGRAPRSLTDDAPWQPYFESRDRDDDGEPSLAIWRRGDDAYRFLFFGATDFFVDGAGERVWARWRGATSIEDAALYLLGPVLGFVLRLRGIVPLHASAAVVEGRAVAFAGPAGSGKSTLAMAFARRGYPILTDDTAALASDGDALLVQPDHPLVRLWPETLELLGAGGQDLPRLITGWEKRYLDLESHGYRFEPRPRPLAAVYLLDGEPAAGRRPEVVPLSGHSAFLALVANTYANQVLDARMRAREFDLLARLFASNPVVRLRRPAGLAPEELCDFLADDFRRRAEAAQAS